MRTSRWLSGSFGRAAVLAPAASLVLAVGAAGAQAQTFGPQVMIGSGFSEPFGVAVDGSGNVFLTDSDYGRVVEVPADGGPQVTIGSGFSGPFGVAVDGSDDVFVPDLNNNRVVEVPAGGGPQITIGSDFNHPFGLTVDGSGDVFVADTLNDRVVEVPAGGGPQITIGSGFDEPYGVAVDNSGDVFVADLLNNRVVEVPAGGGPQFTIGSGFNHPAGVAVDGSGDVFVADSANLRVVEVPAGGGPQVTIASGVTHPEGLAVDGSGDVFIGDMAHGALEVPLIRTTSTSLVSSINPSVSGQSVTYTATVSDTSAAPVTPTGTVAFDDGGSAISGCGTVALSGGQASCTVSYPGPAGSPHQITASYSGYRAASTGVTVYDFGSSASMLSQVVNKAPTKLIASPARQGFLTLTFSARLTRSFDGAPLAGETVVFSARGRKPCPAITNSSGVATCKLGGIAIGKSTYTATFAGDNDYLGTSATGTL